MAKWRTFLTHCCSNRFPCVPSTLHNYALSLDHLSTAEPAWVFRQKDSWRNLAMALSLQLLVPEKIRKLGHFFMSNHLIRWRNEWNIPSWSESLAEEAMADSWIPLITLPVGLACHIREKTCIKCTATPLTREWTIQHQLLTSYCYSQKVLREP